MLSRASSGGFDVAPPRRRVKEINTKYVSIIYRNRIFYFMAISAEVWITKKGKGNKEF